MIFIVWLLSAIITGAMIAGYYWRDGRVSVEYKMATAAMAIFTALITAVIAWAYLALQSSM
jgi:roadblock/LC7 domain-containing protein